MDSSFEANANGRLLVALMREHGCSDPGLISGFFDTASGWTCPCCFRTKAEMARADRRGRLLCAIHLHHDHFIDRVRQQLDPVLSVSFGPDTNRIAVLIGAGHVRFCDTLICNDCNVAEPVAKSRVAAPAYFSFAPFEIVQFIKVRDNAPHEIDAAMAALAYEAAKPSMVFLGKRLIEIAASMAKPSADPSLALDPAMRVWAKARKAHTATKKAAE